jgi:hypothetical protein
VDNPPKADQDRGNRTHSKTSRFEVIKKKQEKWKSIKFHQTCKGYGKKCKVGSILAEK